jgi:hypothetical protein
MDTARRSSRAARSSQPAPTNSHHSSASSNSSVRADRATRSHQKTESPRKSTPTASLSSEPPEEAVAIPAEQAIQTRRKRGRADEKDKPIKSQVTETATTNGNDEALEDDEAVRCICGFDEYPGPPQLGDEDSKNGIKDGIEEPIISVADITEDGAGFFLQCDVCKVWQHGYCVGIMNEDMSPEEYFCEECRKDLHKIFAAPNGYVFESLRKIFIIFIFHPTVSSTRAGGAGQVSQGFLFQIQRNDDKVNYTLSKITVDGRSLT